MDNAYQEGRWYGGCHITHAYMFEANSGSVGIGIDLEGPHGDVSGALWLTEKAYAKTLERFQQWGLTEADWQDPEFSVDPGRWLNGKQASVLVEIERYTAKDTGEPAVRFRAAAISAGGAGRRESAPAASKKALGILQRKPLKKTDDLPF